MKTTLYFTFNSSAKRYVYITILTLLVIVSLPIMAVFSLGTNALSFLSHEHSDTTSIGTTGLYQGPPIRGDYYEWGNCTYWVFYLRQEAGDPIPANWGNAATWALNASLQGYHVDHEPSPGAIMQTADTAGGLGHVAYVTAVDLQSGAWTVSEMNVKGLDIVDQQTLSASAANDYNFIHDK